MEWSRRVEYHIFLIYQKLTVQDFNFQLFGILRVSTLRFGGSPLLYFTFYSNLSGRGVVWYQKLKSGKLNSALGRLYILSLNYFLACKRTKPQKNFFFRGWTFFSEAIGRSVVQPRPQAEAIQADRRPRKKISPTKEIKSSSEVSVSFTAAKNHSLEDRYIFFLRYYVSNQAFQDG